MSTENTSRYTTKAYRAKAATDQDPLQIFRRLRGACTGKPAAPHVARVMVRADLTWRRTIWALPVADVEPSETVATLRSPIRAQAAGRKDLPPIDRRSGHGIRPWQDSSAG